MIILVIQLTILLKKQRIYPIMIFVEISEKVARMIEKGKIGGDWV